MMVSTKGRYALMIMIDLAQNQGEGLVSLSDIAQRQNLPTKYLESVVAILNKGEMLKSFRGKNGGYRLVKEPEEYTINEILILTEGTLAPVECIRNNDIHCDKAANCLTLPLWVGLDRTIENYLLSISLDDIIKSNRKKMLGDWCEPCISEYEDK
ncbi:MAG: Rrf2 family transcriptional regulator [Clostridiales bacterium]|jgi:Rrf2 family protein|nr:Rrf2 family transcriptional regulator [Clostridiales bacterium]